MREARERLWRFLLTHPFIVGGVLLLLVGFSLTLLLAFQSGSEDPPGTGASLALVLVAGFLQFAGAFLFSRENAPNRKVYKNALTRLSHLWRDIDSVRVLAERARDDGSAAALKLSVGTMSVQLSSLVSDAERNIAEWTTLMPGEAATSKPEELQHE